MLCCAITLSTYQTKFETFSSSLPFFSPQYTQNTNNDSFIHSFIPFFLRFMNRFHSLDRVAAKLDKEGQIRNDLARWDRNNPELKHEMIVGTLTSGIISIVVTNLYLSFCRRIRASNRN